MIDVTAAVIRKGEKFLICQPPKGKSCELLWEFPGGKVESGETGEQCVVRECQEELGVTLHVLYPLTEVVCQYSDRTVHLRFYIAEITSGVLTRKEHAAFAWIAADEILNYQFCPADTQMLMGAEWAHETQKNNRRYAKCLTKTTLLNRW